MPEIIRNFRELRVYQAAMEAAMELFEISKRIPPEEKFSLTDQGRRSSRSVCANISEGWRKRRYQAAFVAKMSDAGTEAGETQVWLEVAYRCGYIDQERFARLDDIYEKIISQSVKMIGEPEKWCMRRPA